MVMHARRNAPGNGRHRVIGAAIMAAVGLLAAPIARAQLCWRPPVEGVVVDPFRAPPCAWCPGNRGIDYRVGTNAEVRAAASGTVTFVGVVAGTAYAVVELPSGWRHTYGKLISTRLRSGDRVIVGTTIGQASGEFYFGLRVGDDYRDPEEFLGTWGGRTRLIPSNGATARVSASPVLRCRR